MKAARLEPCSYVSSLLARRLARAEPVIEPELLAVHGALMLTDVEGWTSRVEQLSDTGPLWLDELGRAANAYFIELARIVYAHGGDVVRATGDAFLCAWVADGEGELEVACARAACASIAFQEHASLHVDPNGRRLRTRIGISAGALDLCLVGGVDGRWELLPLGTPLAEVGLAESGAPAGGVAVAPSAWRHLRSSAEGVELGEGGLVALTAPPTNAGRAKAPERGSELTDAALAAYVPAPVRGWNAPTGADWLAELRPVTAVSTRLAGERDVFTEDLERTQQAVRILQQTIARFEGASKPGVDNKGLTLSGVFGVSPRAHSDDRERALRAASAMAEQLRAAGLEPSIGVASGPVLCALFGSDLRREYTISGNAMNLAARLAQASDGGILCDESSSSGLDERFRFEPQSPLRLKGRAVTVPAWALREIRARTRLRPIELVDRDDERAAVCQQLELLRDGRQSGVLVIEGEAGIGKSALAAHAARLAERSGTEVVVAVADAVERRAGYYAWRQTFAEILGVDEAVSEDQLTRRVLALVGEDPDVVRKLPLLTSLLPVEVPDNDFTATLEGDQRADVTVQLLTRLLSCRTSAGATLVVVEDAQWLDTNSWSLLRAIAREMPRTLTLITTRPLPSDSEAQRMLRALAAAEALRLDSLSAIDTAELVRRRLGVDESPAGLARFVEERVAGHPYFCEALVKAMQERGVVRVEDRRAVVADLEPLDLPATVQGAVLSLVDRLTARQQLTLRVAAVAGLAFSTRAVAEAHPTETDASGVEEDLEALRERDLLAADESALEPAYTFRHQITRDVAYGLLTPTQRRALHRGVAEWNERSSSEVELERNAALLAHHWKCAEEPDKAVPHLEKASARALRGGAFREAADLYGQLTAQRDTPAADDVHRLALWEKGEGASYYYLGDFRRSRGGLERALAHLDRPVPQGELALTFGLSREVTRQIAHLARPGRYRDRRTGEQRLLLEAVDAYKMLALVNYSGGESSRELLYLFLAALNLGEEAGASPELASALVAVAGVASLFNLRSLTDRYVSRALQLADDEGQFQALAWIWNVQVVIEAQRGEWRRAIAASDRALELFSEVGDYNYEAEIWQTRAAIHICQGDFNGAEACWTRTRELASRNSNAQMRRWSLLDEVQTQLGRGDTEAAGRAMDAVLNIEDAPPDQHTEIEKHYCLAATRLAEGRSEEALAAADHLLELATARPLSGFWLADFAAGAVEVYLELLEHPRTSQERRAMLRRARKGCRSLRRVAWTFHGVRPRRATLLGRVEWERGRRRRAVRLWRRAESMAERAGMDYELARTRLELVRHDVAGPEREEMLAGAVQTFERLGAGSQLERAARM
jgi:class 3 adenylate cyclase/tetratricopeptide (TPR) repeat protein